jgi:sugar O-acyltransferase (sialic acid O-acetyltransferase NeuD family)
MRRLALLGASGHGKVVADAAELVGWDDVVFFDDAWPRLSNSGKWAVVGDTYRLLSTADQFEGVLVTIGNNHIRKLKLDLLFGVKAKVVSILHPNAQLSRYCSIGPGSVVFAGAVVNVDTTIGIGAIVNTGASIDHDCRLGDFVHLSPGAHLAGAVIVGDLSWIGIGASVRQLVTVGCNATVGAGAAVVKPVPDDAIVVGVPARPMIVG